MKSEINEYIKYIDNLIENNKINDDIIKNHLIKISFFQHERFIHLIVTLFCILIFIALVFLSNIAWQCLIILPILLVMNIGYIIHYYNMENGVQYLYKQYDKMINK